jgi:epsilon-lactone hydrolase
MTDPEPAGVDKAIARVRGIYSLWSRNTSMEQMRSDWDKAFFSDAIPCETQDIVADGVPARWIVASQEIDNRILIYFHGGGFKMGSLRSHHDFMARLSRVAGCKVLGVDYRLVPEHLFPAALDDCLAAYRWVLACGHNPGNIVLAGDSAGGGLVASTLIALRDAGDPMPAAGVMLSALTDLCATGASYSSRKEADPIHNQALILALARQYLGPDGDPRNPLASPLYGNLAGLPPLLIQVGDRETGLDDSVQFAARATEAGVETQLKVWEGMIHFFQQFAGELAEADDAIRDIGNFLKRHFP